MELLDKRFNITRHPHSARWPPEGLLLWWQFGLSAHPPILEYTSHISRHGAVIEVDVAFKFVVFGVLISLIYVKVGNCVAGFGVSFFEKGHCTFSHGVFGFWANHGAVEWLRKCFPKVGISVKIFDCFKVISACFFFSGLRFYCFYEQNFFTGFFIYLFYGFCI